MSYGIGNVIKDTLTGNLKIAETDNSANRWNICQQCEFFRPATLTCGQCGCFMPAKTKLQNSSCPVGKW